MTLKSKDVLFKLGDAQLDPRLVKVLCQLAEEHAENDKVLGQLIPTVERLIEVVGNFSQVAVAMKGELDFVKKLRDRETDAKVGTIDGLIGDKNV